MYSSRISKRVPSSGRGVSSNVDAVRDYVETVWGEAAARFKLFADNA